MAISSLKGRSRIRSSATAKKMELLQSPNSRCVAAFTACRNSLTYAGANIASCQVCERSNGWPTCLLKQSDALEQSPNRTTNKCMQRRHYGTYHERNSGNWDKAIALWHEGPRPHFGTSS